MLTLPSHILFDQPKSFKMVKLFAREEDRPTPKAIYNWRVYSCAIVAATAAIMIGLVHLQIQLTELATFANDSFELTLPTCDSYDSAFIGTSISLASFKQEFGLTLADKTAKEFAAISANIVSTYRTFSGFSICLL